MVKREMKVTRLTMAPFGVKRHDPKMREQISKKEVRANICSLRGERNDWKGQKKHNCGHRSCKETIIDETKEWGLV